MEIVMWHEARQAPAWLIFDVRQKMSARVAAFISLVALLSAGCATIDRFAEFRRFEDEAKGRFLGVLGFALSVPGVEDFERHYSYTRDVFVIPKTSDYFGSQDELEYNRRAEQFAREYNMRLLKKRKPNKAPEPTTRSVTPRAFAPKSECNSWTVLPTPARVAPERVVAHL